MKKEKRAIQIVVEPHVHYELSLLALNEGISLKKYVELLCINVILAVKLNTKQ